MNPVDHYFATSRSLHPQVIGVVLRLTGRCDLQALGTQTGCPVREHTTQSEQDWLNVVSSLRALPLPTHGWDLWACRSHSSTEWLLFFRVHHSLRDGIGVLNIAERWFASATRPHGTQKRASIAGLAYLVRELVARHTHLPAWPASLHAPTGRAYLATAVRPQQNVRDIAECYGVTANDVHMAALAGSVRGLAGGRQPVPICMPLSTRRRSQDDAPGNHLSMARLELPCQHPDSLERLRAVARQTRRIKDLGVAAASRKALRVMPSFVGRSATRRLTGPTCAALCFTHLIAPPEPLRLGEAQVVDAAFVGAILEGHLLYGAVLTHEKTARLTVVGDQAFAGGRDLPALWGEQIDQLTNTLG